MINLNNLTVKFKETFGGSKFYIKSNINGYTPIICVKPFEIERKEAPMYSSLDKTLYNFTSNKELFGKLDKTDFLKKFNFVDYFLANKICDIKKGSGYRRDLMNVTKTNIEDFYKTASKSLDESFKSYSEETEHIINEFVYSGRNIETTGYYHIFNGTGLDFRRGSYNYLLHLDSHICFRSMSDNTTIVVSKGFCGVYNNITKELIPLVMLVVKKDYIPYYRCANLLEMPIDNSKFEMWINDKIEESPSYNFVIKYVLKVDYCVNSVIPILIKSNLEQHFSTLKIPSFSSITEKIEWLGSTKNDFLNEFYSLKEKLPVKEYKIENNPIETVEKKFKSRNLNRIISTAVKLADIKEIKELIIPKTIPKNKFTLTI